MRSRASVSASSARRSQAAVAGVELGRGDAQADLARDRRGRISGSARPAPRSPRARTSAMMARTRLLDVVRGLALGGEQRGKARGEIGGLAVEADRHRAVRPGPIPGPRVNGARPRARQPCCDGSGIFAVQGHGPGRLRRPRPARDRPVRPPGIRPRAAAPRRPRRSAVTTPPGASVSENATASRFSTSLLLGASTLRHLQDSTRSNRSAERQRRNSGCRRWPPPSRSG